MQVTSFPIGFWNYVDLAEQDEHAVKDWADAGMTLTMGPNYGPGQEKKMRKILDAAAERNIQVILSEHRGYWPHLTKNGEKTYRKDFAAAAKALGDHPAVFGFHVGDEPGTAEFEDACRAQFIQKELAPHLTPFLNHLPWYDGVAGRVGYADWSTFLDAYVAKARPELLCYDCYAQMNPGTEGFEMYFRNLNEYQAAAVRGAIPYWTTLLSVGHFRYRCPREDDLRWQLTTALAHGAQGILWFFFYMRQPHDNYRVAPIDEHGERTETFEWLSRVCRTFLKWQAETVRHLQLRKVSHLGKAWGGTPLFDGTGLVSAAHSAQPLIVSEFRHSDGTDYVMMVNNSQTESTHATLWVRGRQPRLHRVGWLGKLQENVQSQSGPAAAAVSHWLAPGQMELFRVTQGE